MKARISRAETRILRAVMILVICLLAGAVASSDKRGTAAEPSGPTAQDVTYLSQRLSALEQRFFNLELTINQLLSQVSIAQAPSPAPAGPPVSREEVGLMRTEIQLLQRQMAEVQCGLLKLDQRTLPPDSRAQLTPAETAEPCRRLANSPVRITAR